VNSLFSIITSDRAEHLSERLAFDLARDPLSPFDGEVIVVQSLGTERWLRNELATQLGCAASTQFPFPAGFCRRLAEGLFGNDDPIDPGYTRETLTWRILEALEQGIAAEAGFEPLRSFVDSGETRKRLGLAMRVAELFDDYQLYRADMLLAWESGGGGDLPSSARWQAGLWRRLCGDDEPRHLARWFTAAVERLESIDDLPAGLPTRISVFGVSTLPPFFVRFLQAAARFVPVRLYLLAPPRETWERMDTAASPLYEAFGDTSRELLALCNGPGAVWEELPQELNDAAPTALRVLQSDVRSGTPRGTGEGRAAPVPLSEGDDSLTLHACHSPMRELEVLRDQLFAAFEADPTLRPHDVLVMVTDVAKYAPIVETVFGVGEPELPAIPYRVADRPLSQESPLATSLLRLLRLAGSRCTAPEVLELFDAPAVRRAAGIPDSASETVVRWIQETAIRWGRDGATRQEVFGLPPIDANSWRAGLDRLLMGYAVGRENGIVAGILPYSGDTTGDPETLGAFARWVERLFEVLDDWRSPRPMHAWRASLREAVAWLLAADDDAEEEALSQLLDRIDALSSLEPFVDPTRALDVSVVRDWLEESLADDRHGTGFLSGGMTVCALKPMRAIPFKVIAVLGLDDGSFPARAGRAGYDLMEIEPRLGDRNRRADDRQLFLDILLAARDRLILSYVGRSAKDNKERAVSVVVAELLDVIDQTFLPVEIDGTVAPPRRQVTCDHRLQPFSDSYYGADRRLFSYSRVNARATVTAAAPRREASPFAGTEPVVALPDGHLAIRLEDLIGCWINPSRFFCEHALGLRFARPGEAVDECEPLEVDKLTEYGVRDRILERHLAGQRSLDTERLVEAARAELPPGELSSVWYAKLDREIAEFIAKVGRPVFREPEMVFVAGNGWSISGRVNGLTDFGRLQLRAAKCKAKDRIRAWITHVVLTVARGELTTLVLGTDGETRWGRVEGAAALLETLVEGYRVASTRPMPVFEGASAAFVSQKRKIEGGGSRATTDPLECAHKAFHGDGFNDFHDLTDDHIALCWRGRDPLTNPVEFERWSIVLWEPLLSAAQVAGEAGVTT
jgi:exodeoxyribonuclease V gamma subunit